MSSVRIRFIAPRRAPLTDDALEMTVNGHFLITLFFPLNGPVNMDSGGKEKGALILPLTIQECTFERSNL